MSKLGMKRSYQFVVERTKVSVLDRPHLDDRMQARDFLEDGKKCQSWEEEDLGEGHRVQRSLLHIPAHVQDNLLKATNKR